MLREKNIQTIQEKRRSINRPQNGNENGLLLFIQYFQVLFLQPAGYGNAGYSKYLTGFLRIKKSYLPAIALNCGGLPPIRSYFIHITHDVKPDMSGIVDIMYHSGKSNYISM